MTEDAQKIQKDILNFIYKYKNHTTDQTDDAFNELAMRVFEYQFQNNLPYKQLAKLRHKNRLTVKKWPDLPLMPIQAYKELTLSTEDINQAADVFYSSGTTNVNHKSKHYISNLAVWEASMQVGFKQHVLPNTDKIRIISLFPGMKDNPNSSLSRYVSTAIRKFGTENSQICWENNQLNYDQVVEALNDAVAKQEAVLLIGASFSYVHLLSHLDKQGHSFKLAKGSVLFDTGGFKGKSKEVDMNELYAELSQYFNVSRSQIINMYGMTEISSQCYDRNLVDAVEKHTVYFDKLAPAWVKIQVLDTETLQPVKLGQRGVLAYYDLANWDSCIAILTEDIVVASEHGFKIIGRAKGAVAKGCSISADEFLQRQPG